jgi:hypothetical protein
MATITTQTRQTFFHLQMSEFWSGELGLTRNRFGSSPQQNWIPKSRKSQPALAESSVCDRLAFAAWSL